MVNEATKDDINLLRESVNKLETTISDLATSIEKGNDYNERIIEHIRESIPIRFVVLICFIICLAFVGGGVLKEVVDLHLLAKWFS